MPEGDLPHSAEPRRRGGLRRAAKALAVLVVVLGVVVAVGWRLDLVDRWELAERLGSDQPDPRRHPAAVEPPKGLDLPDPRAADPVADPLPAAEPDPAAVRRAVGRLLADPRLGRRVAVAVAGLDGRPVVTGGPAVVTPASTLKLLTALAALEALGPEHRFRTEVVATGREVTLVGGGDPLLAEEPVEPDAYPEQADVATLAAQAAEQLRRDGHRSVLVRYDDSLFTGPEINPAWERDYVPDDVVSPVTALWVDQGRKEADDSERSGDPSLAAALAFAAELRRNGVRVQEVAAGAAPVDAARIASVQGAELVEVVQHVLEVSDNEAAEVLARHVALAEGLTGSFADVGPGLVTVMERLGVPVRGVRILDGSGLARGNRLALATLLDTLALGARQSEPLLGGLVDGLPVAGFNGSLDSRFATGADEGLGWVRAKTGTLVAGGVHGLAGVVTARDGTVMLFAVVADEVKVENTLFTRDRLDQVAAALADCACAG